MPDLVALRMAVVTCIADPAAVDAVLDADGAACFRIAEDEAMLLAAPDGVDRLLWIATDAATSVDPDALVVDATDGWAGWRIEGDDARDAFERLSQIALPDGGLALGAVAGVPARVVVDRVAIDVFVGAMVREHVRRRILADCAALAIGEPYDDRAWEARR